jgi:hypothetical protein
MLYACWHVTEASCVFWFLCLGLVGRIRHSGVDVSVVEVGSLLTRALEVATVLKMEGHSVFDRFVILFRCLPRRARAAAAAVALLPRTFAALRPVAICRLCSHVDIS